MINKLTTIKPLIIGLGTAGKRHLEAQLGLGYKTGAYTNNSGTAKTLKENEEVIVFDNLEKGIDWANLVHVCTPDHKHTEFVAKALEKGKAVLCEKAFTTSLEDALYLQKLAHQNSGHLIIGQNYRLTPTFADIRKRVSEGELGSITKIETTYLHDTSDYKQRYKEENFLYTGGSHAIDLAQWIIGEPVVEIKATSEGPLKYSITLTFSSGILGTVELDATSNRDISGTDLRVYGEKGNLVSHNKDEINRQIMTTPLEVKIVDDYLLGKKLNFLPLPDVDEAITTIKILDAVQKLVSSGQSLKIS